MDILLGLYQLKRILPAEALGIFEKYEAQMLNNLHRKRLSHNPEVLRFEQEKMLASLDTLARRYCGKNFDELCINTKVANDFSTVSPIPIHKLVPPDNAIYTPATPRPVTEPGKQLLIKIIEPNLPLPILPTQSFYYEKEYLPPPIVVMIDNSYQGCTSVTLRVHVCIEGYSDPDKKTMFVDEGEQKPIRFMPVLKPDRVATLNDIKPATVHVQVFNRNESIYEETIPIKLHARNTALLAVKASDGKAVDLTDCLATWVTPRDEGIKVLLNQATEYHNHDEFVGYPKKLSFRKSIEIVHKQAQAIFDLLRYTVKLKYIESSNNFGTQHEQIAQSVRLPSEVLSSRGSANCLDGVVLFASLLEYASIDPVILLLPGHAVVGWHTRPGEEQYEFVDTTLIQTEDFTTACGTGQKYYKKAQTQKLFAKEIFDFTGFARLIDIKSCRERGIYTH